MQVIPMFNVDDDVSPKLKEILLSHAVRNWKLEKKFFKLQSDGGVRGYYNIQKIFAKQVVNACNEEIDKVYNKLQVHKNNYLYCRHFLGYNEPGAWVTDHVDQIQFIDIPSNTFFNVENYVEIRLNFFLQRPNSGGQPGIINNGVRTLIENIPNKGWIFNASTPHYSTPVEGNTDRIVVSFGSLLLKEKAQQLGLIYSEVVQ